MGAGAGGPVGGAAGAGGWACAAPASPVASARDRKEPRRTARRHYQPAIGKTYCRRS